jgi:ADP-heptose:LPS heptosyltransferase
MPISSRHILISRQDNIGDVILTLPMAAYLKQINPGVKITLLCRAYATEVVRYCSDIDEVVSIESIKDDLLGYLKKSDIDTVILAQPDHKLTTASFRAGIKHRIGNARQKIYQLLYCNRRVRFSKGMTDNHESQINFEFLRPYGVKTIPTREQIPALYHFAIPHDPAIAAQFSPYQFNLVLHTKSNGHGREWPIEYYLELARALMQHEGVHLWLTGSEKEGRWLKENAAELLAQANVTSVCGTQSLTQLTCFIHQSDGLIASGTGPLHMASAIGQRALGLFPPTRPMHLGRWAALGPRSTNICVATAPCCPGCRRLPDPTCDCMRAIKPDLVLEVVEDWLKQKTSSAQT